MTTQQTPNADEATYADKRASYVKGLKHLGPGLVDPAAFGAFRDALGHWDGATKTFKGGTANFETTPPLIGAGRKLNGPQGAFAKSIAGDNPEGFASPAAPELKSPEYAVELVELYWGSMLRDVPFAQYETHPLATAAAAELNSPKLKPHYFGPLDNGNVTPRVLFRGGGNRFGLHKRETWFAGEEVGPYVSQLCLQPTQLGALQFDQKFRTYTPHVDYLTDFSHWFDVQRGVAPPTIQFAGAAEYLHSGRNLAAYTHVDELYQAYLIAYLVLNSLGIPSNPGSPYNRYAAQQPFGTFGGPDIAATLGTVAKMALNAVWYQKWVAHLRHRPESGGGLVHMINAGYKPDGKTILYDRTVLDSLVLDSEAVRASQAKWGSYLLSQAFPEGSPTHPAYPTGHGTVAGACITVLKFFFKGEAVIPRPVTLSGDGKTLEPYSGVDSGRLTVNGELHKLAHNISFGHGIHAGIHWRSDTDLSIALGEMVAINFLEAAATTYREPFEISFTKIDGTSHTIKNP